MLHHLYETPGDNIQVPDYIPGYAVAGKTSATANLTTVLRAPLDSVNDTTCAECMRKMLKWIGAVGDAVIWWDYTTINGAGAPCPTLKISTRDLLPSLSLPFVASNTAAVKIKRRDDLIPPAVEIKFRIQGNFDGQNYTQVIRDVAATIGGTVIEGIGVSGALETVQTWQTGSPAYVGGAENSATMQALQNAGRDFGAACNTMDMEGPSGKLEICTFSTIPVNIASPNALTNPSNYAAALAFWKTVFPELADITNPDFYPGTTVAVVDDNGNPINVGTFQYLLTRNQVASWMLQGNSYGGTPIQSTNAHITVAFNGKENSVGMVGTGILGGGYTATPVQTGNVLQHIKHATVTLVTLPGNTYTNQVLTNSGEVIPYGLAGYIYKIAKIPQYEGSYTLQETEITDVCPLGNNLNITGSLAEWAAMNAMVQQISYDLTSGRTTITFGPAGHMGCKDLVERIRINRGPRWFNLNGSNVANNPGADQTQFASDVAKQDPSHGTKAENLKIHPVDLGDLAGNFSAYTTGCPGVTIDTRPEGQPNYGGHASDAPKIWLAEGVDGALETWIRLSIDDLPNGTHVWFQPVQLSISGGSCVTAYVLCGVPPS